VAKHRGVFNPQTHARNFPEFMFGSILAGIFLGAGFALGTVLLRGLIRKYERDPRSLLEIGLPGS